MKAQATPSRDAIAALVAPTLDDLGFDLVQVSVTGGNRPTLQVMAEPKDRARGMTVDDCAQISHAVSAVLDVADPIAGAYALEVSSPGIDRPLVRPGDFVRFKGHEVRLDLREPQDGRKRLRGRLDGFSNEGGAGAERGHVVVTVDGTAWRVPFERIRRAKLVMTDALIAAALKGEAAAPEVKE